MSILISFLLAYCIFRNTICTLFKSRSIEKIIINYYSLPVDRASHFILLTKYVCNCMSQ